MTSSTSPASAERTGASRRTAWLVAGLLLLAAGSLTATSHLVFWSSCFGSGQPDICQQRSAGWLSPPFMADPAGRLPWVTGTAAVGSLLAGVSWLVALRALSLSRVSRVLGLLVAAQTTSIGLWSVVSAFTGLISPELPVSRIWWVGGELMAVALVLAMLSDVGSTRAGLVEWVWGLVAVVGATTFGMLHWVAEMLVFGGSLGKGEPGPGAGLGLAAALLICGGALLVRYRLQAPRRQTGRGKPVGRLARL